MRALACVLLLLAAPAHAQMYKCTEGGKTRYSDKPITDCKNVEVKGQANTAVSTPTPGARRAGPISQKQQEFDNRCAQLRREHKALQRSPDSPARDQRLEAMQREYNACN